MMFCTGFLFPSAFNLCSSALSVWSVVAFWFCFNLPLARTSVNHQRSSLLLSHFSSAGLSFLLSSLTESFSLQSYTLHLTLFSLLFYLLLVSDIVDLFFFVLFLCGWVELSVCWFSSLLFDSNVTACTLNINFEFVLCSQNGK